ncbi:winged helix-turn-helix domain-containing protein [Halomicrobium salinisoli]|uniref:winged helix-turn-helix domain-containing protein n=1 Tax=Halomicrobium salinisoli TaxID=2878391 RepID=UPI001CF00AA1|nr:helix-turn-helix domain-containing protein [Halomicrobium salinisoli]
MTEDAVSEDADLADVVGLLDDEHVRSILVATSAEPLSAKELGERCDVSVSSIYRRVDELRDIDLLEERTRPRSDGHHETVYVSALDRFELTIRDGDLDWTVDRAGDDVADELSRMWGNF